MKAMPPGSWISQSGQTWKLGVFYFLILAALFLLVAFIMTVNHVRVLDNLDAIELALAFVVTAAVSMMWLCLSIRCPRCAHRPVWYILRTAAAGNWLITLHTMEQCPSCKSQSSRLGPHF